MGDDTFWSGEEGTGEPASGIDGSAGESAAGPDATVATVRGERPTSVTAISILIIIGGVASLLLILVLLSGTAAGDPTALASMVIALVAGAVMIAAAVAMLRGLNWGRWLYVGFWPLSLLVGNAISGFSLILIPQLTWYGMCVAFLTTPTASAYFRGQPAPSSAADAQLTLETDLMSQIERQSEQIQTDGPPYSATGLYGLGRLCALLFDETGQDGHRTRALEYMNAAAEADPGMFEDSSFFPAGELEPFGSLESDPEFRRFAV